MRFDEFWKKGILLASIPACIVIPVLTSPLTGIPASVDTVSKNFEKLEEQWEEAGKHSK